MSNITNKTYDVFLSYHGGAGDSTRSSYAMAEKLYYYLKQRNMNPFLYKKENDSDFYDAINTAILGSRHFILIACDKDMLSEWVKDEIKQFDGLRKNGQKTNSLISACIFGNITEADLYRFNTVFTTKDIVHGEQDFKRLYQAIVTKDAEITATPVQEIASTMNYTQEQPRNDFKTFSDISKMFIQLYLSKCTNTQYASFAYDDYSKNCETITKRLKCMSSVTIPKNCDNVIEEYFNRILKLDKSVGCNIMQVAGQSGTQKSYVLQLLYIRFFNSMDTHNYDPIYISCDAIRNMLMNGKTADQIEQLFSDVQQENGRSALFIIDGIRNIVADNYRIDFLIKKISDKFENVHYIIGKNIVHCDNPIRANKSGLAKGRYGIMLNLSPISLYDKEKCYSYISTIKNLPLTDITEIYKILNKSGLLTIDEYLIRTICENYDGVNAPRIMNVFEDELLNNLDGDYEMLKRGADIIFEFAYGKNETIDFNDETTLDILNLICNEQIYLYCLIALYYTKKLDEYDNTGNYDFFQMVMPKEITRFITQRINEYPKHEDSILTLAGHYNEMSAMGKSEMSFFLGRIKSANQRAKAIELLHTYYDETSIAIKQKLIDDKYNGKTYSHDAYKQDLFLFRGLSVSLIYCGDKKILYDYIRSLIDNDLSNSINRGFHLEYYGDIRYIPNQNMLTYEDNPKLGERTLRILCNSVYTQLKSGELHPAILLELFTITSLLQIRIETSKNIISFDITEYITRCKELIPHCLSAINCDDNIITSFFQMAVNDFEKYLASKLSQFSPKRYLCNDYLAATEIKRAGWVMQNVPHPESIVEHMYSCWFIALTCLPNTDLDIPEYNKQKIMDMLLVHDLAETKLKDIPKYEKPNYPDYDKKENHEMLAILLKGTYDGMDVMTPFVNAWDEWYTFESINAKIAKDIDTIQAIYQFLVYNQKYPQCFGRERKIGWLNEMQCVTTKYGRLILEEIILHNELFHDTLEEYGYLHLE